VFWYVVTTCFLQFYLKKVSMAKYRRRNRRNDCDFPEISIFLISIFEMFSSLFILSGSVTLCKLVKFENTFDTYHKRLCYIQSC